jgi:hypothetical protein
MELDSKGQSLWRTAETGSVRATAGRGALPGPRCSSLGSLLAEPTIRIAQGSLKLQACEGEPHGKRPAKGKLRPGEDGFCVVPGPARAAARPTMRVRPCSKLPESHPVPREPPQAPAPRRTRPRDPRRREKQVQAFRGGPQAERARRRRVKKVKKARAAKKAKKRAGLRAKQASPAVDDLEGLGESTRTGVGSASGAPGPCCGTVGADPGDQGTCLGICGATPDYRAHGATEHASLCAERQSRAPPVVDDMKEGDPPGGRVDTGTPDLYGLNDGRADPGGRGAGFAVLLPESGAGTSGRASSGDSGLHEGLPQGRSQRLGEYPLDQAVSVVVRSPWGIVPLWLELTVTVGAIVDLAYRTLGQACPLPVGAVALFLPQSVVLPAGHSRVTGSCTGLLLAYKGWWTCAWDMLASRRPACGAGGTRRRLSRPAWPLLSDRACRRTRGSWFLWSRHTRQVFTTQSSRAS